MKLSINMFSFWVYVFIKTVPSEPHLECSVVFSTNGRFLASYVLNYLFHCFFDTYSTYNSIQYDIKATIKYLKETEKQ